MKEALNTIAKVFELYPVVKELVKDVQAAIKAAKAPGSAGGTKVTAGEVTEIVADAAVAWLPRLIKALMDVFAKDIAA